MIQNGYFSDCETPWPNCTQIRKIVLFSPCCLLPCRRTSLLNSKVWLTAFELYTYYSLAFFSTRLLLPMIYKSQKLIFRPPTVSKLLFCGVALEYALSPCVKNSASLQKRKKQNAPGHLKCLGADDISEYLVCLITGLPPAVPAAPYPSGLPCLPTVRQYLSNKHL